MGACIASTTDAQVQQEAELARARLVEARRLQQEERLRQKAAAGERAGTRAMLPALDRLRCCRPRHAPRS
jgi:hypothetical protein